MKQFVFDGKAFDDFTNLAVTDIKTFLRVIKLLNDIDRTPFKGIGNPEPLKFNKSGYWSRRINEEHRLIYKVVDDKILIAGCTGHYK